MINFSQLKNIQRPSDMLSPIYIRYTNIPSNIPLTYYGIKSYEPNYFTDKSRAYLSFPYQIDPNIKRLPSVPLRQRYI